MKLTYNWLKDFVELRIKPQELADKLTMAGLEVTSQEQLEDDYVFEIEITSNRPDWLSVIGIAREIAALSGKEIKRLPGPGFRVSGNQGKKIKGKEQLAINIQDTKACSFYSARVIRNVKVKPSPQWMMKRLLAIGLRPINNIVDITNYVLLTTGQPMHAFDLDKLKGGKILVRFAKNGEEILSIDGIRRKLTPEVLVIADSHNPIAIAGIMGGKDSEVNESTRNILLEGAYFSPIVTRKSGRLLGLSSDSSYRFERSVDKGNIVNASSLAASLIIENAGGEIGAFYRCGSDKLAKKSVLLDTDKANKLIGIDLAPNEAKSILKSLGFSVAQQKKNILKIGVPDFRKDIKSQTDLAEELCRISGYESVPLTLPAIKPQGISEDGLLLIREKIRELLTGMGFSEAITYSLLSRLTLRKAGISLENNTSLENPLSAEQEILRPRLLPGLLPALSRNLELGNRPGLFFEIGECFSQSEEWMSLGIIAGKYPLLKLKGVLESLMQRLGIKNYKFCESENPLFQKGRSAALFIEDKEIGSVGQISKEILLDFKIDGDEVTALEINLNTLKAYARFQNKYQPLPQYPAVERDVSLIVDEAVSYQTILDTINGSQAEYLEEVRFKDAYRSEAVGRGKKSLTLSLEFRSPEKTLTDAQVNASFEKILQAASISAGARVR
ncbi:phenylalanine--tRNA ligase subunit beta [bacterium]|nr:MAG: phenylalanine--tRNA ligase subunit beta [bacterium]